MKYCDCIKWVLYIGKWQQPESPFDSSGVNIPMYFGVAIDYCPWCGERLKDEMP